jgi:hypothetical protein
VAEARAGSARRRVTRKAGARDGAIGFEFDSARVGLLTPSASPPPARRGRGEEGKAFREAAGKEASEGGGGDFDWLAFVSFNGSR